MTARDLSLLRFDIFTQILNENLNDFIQVMANVNDGEIWQTWWSDSEIGKVLRKKK
jgi:hypothetical protein